MNQDIIQGKWKQLKGSLKTHWGKLTDDDVNRLDGNHQYLSGKLQERYGWAKEKADEEIKRFEKTLH
ncbi:MAG: CsbD family protein [Dokdonella sp.]